MSDISGYDKNEDDASSQVISTANDPRIKTYFGDDKSDQDNTI